MRSKGNLKSVSYPSEMTERQAEEGKRGKDKSKC